MKELNYNTSILVVAIHARNDANNFKLLYPKIKEETKYTLCLNGDKTSQTSIKGEIFKWHINRNPMSQSGNTP